MSKLRASIRSLVAVLAFAILVTGAARAEIDLGFGSRVLSSTEVLDHCITNDDGQLVLHLPGAKPWALDMSVTAGEDASEIHIISPLAAAAAWRQIDPRFTRAVPVTIVVLPAPRIGLPLSSAEDGVIFLSPGSAPYTSRQIAFLVAHEFGHCVHRSLMPDAGGGWNEYRNVRGIKNEAVFHNWAPHGSRPREIFAEDFRFLFGGADANYSGGIENSVLPLPGEVEGLYEFMERFVEPTASALNVAPAVAVTPVPSRGSVTIRLRSDLAESYVSPRLRIVDVNGRFVRVLSQRSAGASSGMNFVWDGRLEQGAEAPSGVYYVIPEPVRALQQAEADVPTGRVVLLR